MNAETNRFARYGVDVPLKIRGCLVSQFNAHPSFVNESFEDLLGRVPAKLRGHVLPHQRDQAQARATIIAILLGVGNFYC
jgi:hypothetical protein